MEAVIHSCSETECRPSPVFAFLSFTGGSLLPIGMFMLGRADMGLTGAILVGIGIGCTGLASLAGHP